MGKLRSWFPMKTELARKGMGKLRSWFPMKKTPNRKEQSPYMKKFVFSFFYLSLCSMAAASALNSTKGRIPDEYESDGGVVLGSGMGGVAAANDQGSVRANPAMMVFDKVYKISAGYHWPSVGREYYQAGVIDSKTSSIAAGLTYTSALDEFKKPGVSETAEQRFQNYYDSPLKKRVSLALAQPVNNFALGVGGQFIETIENEERLRGTTLGLGIAGLLNPALRFSLSGENLGNKKIKEYAPQTYRASLAYLIKRADLSIHLDYKQRERVNQEKIPFSKVDSEPEVDPNASLTAPERMLLGSFHIRLQDLLRVVGSYGHEFGGQKRSSLVGGLVIDNNLFSLSFLAGQPYTEEPALIHQAVNFSMQVSL
ncbi:MAG: hypothetical protein KA436_06365 [Oligoflexales bacterium]|nr:hypothetical protein [Oligoflexales bacterium]